MPDQGVPVDEELRQAHEVRKQLDVLWRCVAWGTVTASTCKRACRGQIDPQGRFAQHTVSESDDVRCVLRGLKPLALVHRLDSFSAGCVALSGGLVLPEETSLGEVKQNHRPLSGAALVCLPDHVARAHAASDFLHRIGVWKRPRAGARTQVMTEMQAHIGLGALLGYPLADLEGLHRSLCAHSGNPSGLPCGSFYSDGRDPSASLCLATILETYGLSSCRQKRPFPQGLRSIQRARAAFAHVEPMLPVEAERWKRQLACFYMKRFRSALKSRERFAPSNLDG